MSRFAIYCKRRPRCHWDFYGVRHQATREQALEDAQIVARKNLADVQAHGAPEAQIMVREYPDDLDPPEHLSGSIRATDPWRWNGVALHSEPITA